MHLRRQLPIVSLSLGLTLVVLAVVRADEVVLVPNSTVKGAIGGRVRGIVQTETPTEVTVKLGNTVTSVPTGEIDTIKYDGEPPSMVLAESKETAGLLSDAADLYKEAIEKAAGKPFVQQAAQFGRANALAELALADPSRTADALAALDVFIKAAPNGRHVVTALESLARIQLQKGDTAAVGKTIADMAKQPQGADRAAVLRAKVLAKTGDHDKAIAEYDKLIKSSQEGSVRQREARLAKAESLVAQKKYAEAETEVRTMIKGTPPEDVQAQSAAYNTLGDCLRSAGKPKDALLAYLRTDILYGKDKEQHPRALANIVKLWRELKRDDRADDVLQKLKQDYPASPWVAAATASASAGGGQ